MKTSIKLYQGALLLAGVLLTTTLFGQTKSNAGTPLWNNSFEGWDMATNSSFHKRPTNWNPMLSNYSSDTIDLLSVKKDTAPADVIDGTWSMKMQAGEDSVFPALKCNQPFSAADSFLKLTGYYKYQGDLTDSFVIQGLLTDSGNTMKKGGGTTFAQTTKVLDTNSAYQRFTVEFSYQSIPEDSFFLELGIYSSSGKSYIAAKNTKLLVDSFAVTTTTSSVGIPSKSKSLQFEVTPNPTDEQFTISLENPLPNGSVHIYNSLGKLVETKPMHGIHQRFNISDYSPGLYLLKVKDEESVRTKKLLVR